MFDTRDQILNQLRAGEDGHAEFKEVCLGDRGIISPNVEDLAGELVAFANAASGVVFLGIDDSSVVRGIPPEHLNMVEHWIINVATHNCEPPVRFVARFMQTPSDTRPSNGDDVPHDLDIVDEAIVNAVAHRDYAISGSKIRLFLFADRLELYSPGKLPHTLTLDDMPYRTFTRNQLLVSFLSRIRSRRTGQVFLESRGEGVRKIIQDGEAHSGRRPEYSLFGDELRLTLWARERRAV